MLVRVLIAIGGGLLVSWLALVLFVLAAPCRGADAASGDRSEAGLLRRIAADRSVRRGVRVRLWLLFAYLAFPIDLVPDFVPVIGYADDVVVVAATLRSVVRGAGPDVVRRHWPGTTEGFVALWRLARLPGDP